MLAQVTSCLGTASRWSLPFTKCALAVANRVKDLAIYWFSAKQLSRPDSLLETIQYTSPNIRGWMTLQYWKLRSLFGKDVCDKEARQYFQALTGIKKLNSEFKEPLTFNEKASLILFFQKGLLQPVEIERLNLLLVFNNDPTLSQSHMVLQKMLRMQQEAFFNGLLLKIQGVEKCLADDDIENGEKLEITDCSVIGSAASMCDLIKSLQEQEIPGLELMLSRWQTIRAWTQSSPFDKLVKLCFESNLPGSIFLGDWRNYEMFFGRGYDCTRILQQLFMGSWGHMGIRVNLGNGKSGLSHVNSGTNNHAISSNRNELIMPFYHSCYLDIEPLIPKAVPEIERRELQETFLRAFHKLALEHHPELYVGGSKEQLEVLLFGHKTLFAQPLAEVNIPSKGSRVLCSSYVGIIFLRSIQEVNIALQQKGYRDRIAHPFGSYESIAHLDVLRLVHLWNQLKIIKEIPIHSTIAKVMALP